MEAVTVVKVGGAELDEPAFLDGLCGALAAFSGPLVLVHGGGKEITAALERFGHQSRFVDGLRVTPPEALTVMEMVVSGSISKRLVARLAAAGRPALGLSGVDLGLVRCTRYVHPSGQDLGRVGAVTSVNASGLHTLLKQGWLPLLAPVALGEQDCLAYNVNADHIAQAVATALAAIELLFVSNVPGVLIDGQVAPQLSAAAIEAAIGTGSISGGMIPKVRSALAALGAGVAAVRITNLAGIAGGGTRIVAG